MNKSDVHPNSMQALWQVNYKFTSKSRRWICENSAKSRAPHSAAVTAIGLRTGTAQQTFSPADRLEYWWIMSTPRPPDRIGSSFQLLTSPPTTFSTANGVLLEHTALLDENRGTSGRMAISSRMSSANRECSGRLAVRNAALRTPTEMLPGRYLMLTFDCIAATNSHGS